MIATGGALVAAGRRFSFEEVQVTTAVIDVDATRMSQIRNVGFRPQLGEDPSIVRTPFEFPGISMEPANLKSEDWEAGPHVKEEEFTRAEALALFDYLRKSRSQGFVVSLSGGADSAACACLVHLMCALALRELRSEELARRLRHVRGLMPGDALTLTKQLLTTAYQASENSGETTRNAALTVAETVGASHLDWNISGLVKDYVQTIEQATGAKLNWQQHDIPLQNIQARVRSPGIWLVANLKHALLLSISNRSEAAVGYATMDGDTSGGLSPLAGIDKAWLRYWLKWLETVGPAGLKPIPALSVINVQTPTAELRPAESKQTDEDDLMPYEVLDTVERAAIRDRRPPLEVFEILRVQFGQHDAQQLGVWVERFFTLWCRNQWKRERYAPSFHLDDENLDPKTWCRFPILSGGFEAELMELREHMARLA